jgi:hypothetical protein
MREPGHLLRAPVLLLTLYSPKCLEEEFCELRLLGILRTSVLPWCSDVLLCHSAHTLPSHRSMLASLRVQLRPREGAGQLPVLLLDEG